MRFSNRSDAGKMLGEKLSALKGEDVVVLALPRGGVSVALEVAKHLSAPLDLILVKKISHPFYSEYAIGAVAGDSTPVYSTINMTDIDPSWLSEAENAAKKINAERRVRYYGQKFSPVNIKGKTAIIVDDGMATGLTMQAAIKSVIAQKPKRIIVAVPVAPTDTVELLRQIADEVEVIDKPENFQGAVGAHYEEFEQVNDEEVIRLLKEAKDGIPTSATASTPTAKAGPAS